MVQIYVTSENGSGWFDVGTDADEMREEIDNDPEISSTEWTIDESSPEIDGVGSMSLEDLCEIAEIVDSSNEDAFCAWLNCIGVLDYVKNHFDEAYHGEYSNEEDFAREYLTGIYAIPSFIEVHIDWESVARDLGIHHDYVDAPGGGIYVFRCL